MENMRFVALLVIYLLYPIGLLGLEERWVGKIEEAAEVLEEIMQEEGIPKDLLSKCAGIAIFPSTIKGGFLLGGRSGEGIIMGHDPEEKRWSPPLFFKIGGLSFGFQIGVQSIDLILVITNKRGLRGLLKERLTLGADVGVAAGPVGISREASTDLTLKATVLSYSKARGIFAGIALNGAVITPIEEANRELYGDLTIEDVLIRGKGKMPHCATPLLYILKGSSGMEEDE